MMLSIEAKIIAALVLIVAFGGMWMGLNHYKTLAKTESDRADMIQAGATLYQEKVEAQAKDVAEYQSQLNEKLNENSNLRDAVNANRKRLSVHAVCSPAQTTEAGATGTAEVVDPIVRSNIFNLRAGIITLESNYALCLKELD